MNSDNERDRELVNGLARGMRVLEAFNEVDREMSLSEVARRTAMSPAAVRRSLHTLIQLGYIRKLDRRFLLSARVLSLGSAYLRLVDIEHLLLPELQKMANRLGDTAGIAVLVDTNILYVAHHCVSRSNRPVAGTGVTYPAFVTSLGRVLLAYLSELELDDYFSTARFDKYTRFTETSPKCVRAVLRQIPKTGYGIVVDQLFYGVTSLAVPIFNSTGEVVAALNTSVYTGQMTVQKLIEARLPELKTASARLSEIITHHPLLLKSLQTARSDKSHGDNDGDRRTAKVT